MTEKTAQPDPSAEKTDRKQDGPSTRQDRQGAALRANLKKRKQQAKARQETGKPSE